MAIKNCTASVKEKIAIFETTVWPDWENYFSFFLNFHKSERQTQRYCQRPRAEDQAAVFLRDPFSFFPREIRTCLKRRYTTSISARVTATVIGGWTEKDTSRVTSHSGIQRGFDQTLESLSWNATHSRPRKVLWFPAVNPNEGRTFRPREIMQNDGVG